MAKKNQRERILDYVRENGSITTLEATNELYIMCLWRRIEELEKNCGYKFKRERINTKDRYGTPCHYTRYSLDEVNVCRAG